MTREEDSYKIGEKAFFYECGEIDRVRILANNSNSDDIKYGLEVLEVIKKSELFESEIVGRGFECRKKRVDAGNRELWSLMEKWNKEN
tara:strand:+ start:1040 stop:1303 length:264 start_codon:yes stop_codon:yes gene_type:complete